VAGLLHLPADLGAVAEGRQATAVLPLLACELFGSALSITIPLVVADAVPDGDLLDVRVVGAAPLPPISLADACRTQLPAFAREVVQGGVQALRWRYRLDRASGCLVYSELKLFAEPAWKDEAGNERCLNLARTVLISPSL
jgi:hypothetical protein